jgi:hypothetical protein
MIVFLKTSEEAKCDSSTVCKWTYTETLPTVTEVTTEFDADAEKWQVIIQGTGFTGDPDSVELEINQIMQKAISVTPTAAVFEITDINDLKPTPIQLFFPVGIPEGHAIVQEGFTLEPKLTSISPNEGSFE